MPGFRFIQQDETNFQFSWESMKGDFHLFNFTNSNCFKQLLILNLTDDFILFINQRKDKFTWCMDFIDFLKLYKSPIDFIPFEFVAKTGLAKYGCYDMLTPIELVYDHLQVCPKIILRKVQT